MAVVAIIGRPNVGKSSLFNRIAGRREAIVDDQPGVTRDRLYTRAEWQGKAFYLVDTGGMTGSLRKDLAGAVYRQVQTAIEESDVLLFVVDAMDGSTPLDEEIALQLRKTGKPVILVVNKIDDVVHEKWVYDLYSLGFENVVGVSSSHGRNIGDLLDTILPYISETPISEEAHEIKLALVGRPNVGKSTLLNALAKTERALVEDVPGTTRDSIDTLVFFGEKPFRIIDTAGLRKRSKIRSDVEFYSLVRTQASIDRSDITILLMQTDPLCTDQDKKIAAHVADKGKGLLLVVNKWDLLSKEPRSGDLIRRTVREKMPFVDFAPLLFLSAKTGRGLQKVPELVEKTVENRKRVLPDELLGKIVRESFLFERMPSDNRGKKLSIFKCVQTGTEPPHFEFRVNDPKIVTTSFERHVHRFLRNIADFEGSPLRVTWKTVSRKRTRSLRP
ncbi:MAG: ribosome biogenesis GTPase Der [Thermovirgaceae bacterium]